MHNSTASIDFAKSGCAGCLIAMGRVNRPSLMVYGGTIRAGCSSSGEQLDIVSAFQSYGSAPLPARCLPAAPLRRPLHRMATVAHAPVRPEPFALASEWRASPRRHSVRNSWRAVSTRSGASTWSESRALDLARTPPLAKARTCGACKAVTGRILFNLCESAWSWFIYA
jgi:hypothetical protein